MRSRATADRAAPRLGVFASVLLHLALIASIFVSFSKKLDIPTDSLPVVPVDLVTVGEQTNIAPMVAPEPAAPPKPEMLEPAPQPDMQAPKFEITPDAKPAPKKEESKKEQFAALLEQLTTKPPANAKTGARTIQGVGAQTAMTADLATALMNQIRPCWSPPMGVKPSDLAVVAYEIRLTPDGRISGDIAPAMGMSEVNTKTMDINTEAQKFAAIAPMAAAQSAAKKAIRGCEPYKLPVNRYREWNDVILVFDPRQMVQ